MKDKGESEVSHPGKISPGGEVIMAEVFDKQHAESTRPEKPSPKTEKHQTSMTWQLPVRLSSRELGLGIVVLVLWFAFFAGGIIIPTEPYRNNISGGNEFSVLMKSWMVVLAFWTITNIGVLACLSAFLGALGRRARFTKRTDLQGNVENTSPNTYGLATYYVSALMRGFGVYALVLAGMLVLATGSLINPDQGTYMRLAPTVSIISFYAGYDPSILAALLDRVKTFLNSTDHQQV